MLNSVPVSLVGTLPHALSPSLDIRLQLSFWVFPTEVCPLVWIDKLLTCSHGLQPLLINCLYYHPLKEGDLVLLLSPRLSGQGPTSCWHTSLVAAGPHEFLSLTCACCSCGHPRYYVTVQIPHQWLSSTFRPFREPVLMAVVLLSLPFPRELSPFPHWAHPADTEQT